MRNVTHPHAGVRPVEATHPGTRSHVEQIPHSSGKSVGTNSRRLLCQRNPPMRTYIHTSRTSPPSLHFGPHPTQLRDALACRPNTAFEWQIGGNKVAVPALPKRNPPMRMYMETSAYIPPLEGYPPNSERDALACVGQTPRIGWQVDRNKLAVPAFQEKPSRGTYIPADVHTSPPHHQEERETHRWRATAREPDRPLSPTNQRFPQM